MTSLLPQVHRFTLPDKSTAIIRPLRPDDGPRLVEGLRALSSESRRRRFLFSKGDFSTAELNYFTHCDGAHHIALVLVETDADGHEGEFVAVGRSIQDTADTSFAEVAIAVADEWQHHGVGERLIRALAKVVYHLSPPSSARVGRQKLIGDLPTKK
mgnify:CR=1 FL=1